MAYAVELAPAGPTLTEFSEGSIVSDDLRTLDGSSFDGEPRQDGLYEERFRVDRRKLESMLLAPVEGTHEVAAEKFFQRVMLETNTIIQWPLKLKVGSKSKRDPHVRVAGDPEKVHEARERIMAVLDTRQSNRVLMKMEVSYTDHSHIIGRAGTTITRVMADTQCHVHFPDSNRTNATEKSNQVSVSGEMPGVEAARARVRELMPLVVLFEPPITGALQQFPELDSPFIQQLQQLHNVQITFRPRSRGPRPGIVSVKGCEWEMPSLKKAVSELVDYFCGPMAAHANVYLNLEISPQQHAIVQGAHKLNLQLIRRMTNTSIVFPDLSDLSIPSLRKNTVSIRGPLDSVLYARHLLLGSLPLVLTFDVREEAEPEPGTVANLMSCLDVTISIRTKPKQTIKSVVVRGYERNAANIYEARRILLGLDEPRVVVSIPETYLLPSNETSASFRSTISSLNSVGPPQPYYNMGYPLAAAVSNFYPARHQQQQQQQLRYQNQPDVQTQLRYPQHQQPRLTVQNLDAFNALHTELYPGGYRPGSGTSSGISSPTFHSRLSSPFDLATIHMDSNSRPGSSNDFNSCRVPCDKSLLPSAYEDKQLLAYQAMRQQPLASRPRVPTNLWAGYGFSHSARSALSGDIPLLGLPLRPEDDDTGPWEGTPVAAPKPAARLMASVSNGLDGVSSLPQGNLSDVSDLPTLLYKFGLTEYIDLFAKHEVDLSVFSTLTEKDLQTLGFNKFGVRKRLLLAITELNKKRTTFCPAPGAERRGANF